ncbi:acyl carrier protein [Nevskia soli]|uniref:acyl carrier protein n=1 Tax=Nevskia soli TaxID=418856 RepID=UPI0004A6C23F|nr:acyl carrier protein [Nevskia soli]
MADIEAQIREIVVLHLDVNEKEVTLDANFEDLGADSLDATEFIMALEDKFSIKIPDEDAEKVSSLRNAIDTVARLSKDG